MHKYMNEITNLALENIQVQNELFQVLHLLKPPSALLQPKIAAQVLRRTTRRRADAPVNQVQVSIEDDQRFVPRAE